MLQSTAVQFGQYRLQQKVGQGGMAEIWLATRTGVEGFEKPVAVKRILGKHREKDRFLDLFISEAKLSSRLQHRNIVQIHELGVIDGDYFISMEYVDGWDLLRILHRAARTRRPLSAAIAIHIMSEVCRGLHHAHRATAPDGTPLNIVHFDVSPSNVLINTSGAVKVSDFGVARAAMKMGEGSASDRFRGKVAYMSPEQLENKAVDHRSDIFSVGIVLYEAMTLKRLFRARTDQQTLANVRAADIEPRLHRHPEIPSSIKDVLRRCLARRADDRFESAADVAEALDAFLFDNRVRVTSRDVARFMETLFVGVGPGGARPGPQSASFRTPGQSAATTFPVASETGLLDGQSAGQILARLSARNATGMLMVRRSPVRKEFYFAKGRIVFVSSNLEDDQLGSFLVNRGTLTREQADAARDEAETRGLGIEAGIVMKGLVPGADLTGLLEELAVSQIDEVFGWKEGYFSFHPEQHPPAGALKLRIDPVGLIAGCLDHHLTTENVAAWFARAGNPKLVPSKKPVFPVERLRLTVSQVRTVNAILRESGTPRDILRTIAPDALSRPKVLRLLMLLHQTGFLLTARS